MAVWDSQLPQFQIWAASIRARNKQSTSPLQACTGIPSGCEAAVHAMTKLLKEPEIQGVLLVDAANAFNSLNRRITLHNISYVCPALATMLKNCYQTPSHQVEVEYYHKKVQRKAIRLGLPCLPSQSSLLCSS